ncbi:hypothetical protein EV424DRAFT_1475611 [Suillus variegatus]|nr:hypothetical protein EV424DRAFT_1475611 [Suillus variegatus]
MSSDGNNLDSSRKHSGSALCLGSRKKVSVFFAWASLNPLVLHGQHFGCTVFALCNYPSLLTAGILRLEELQHSPIEDYPAEVFMELIDSYHGLLDRLMNGKEEYVIHTGELLGKGASGVRGDDTKTLKSAVLKWLGFNHEVTGALLCPIGLDWSNAEIKQNLNSGETAVRGDQWPMLLYAGYDYDPEDPWKGLLKSEILVYGFNHIFTSPSSVDKESKATRSSNAYLHGMKSVTKGSVAYIATQVQFSLSSSSVFSWMDMVTDSENFYLSILDLLEDPDESQEVADLIICRIFPNSSSLQQCISANSALSKICARCTALQEQASVGTT